MASVVSSSPTVYLQLDRVDRCVNQVLKHRRAFIVNVNLTRSRRVCEVDFLLMNYFGGGPPSSSQYTRASCADTR